MDISVWYIILPIAAVVKMGFWIYYIYSRCKSKGDDRNIIVVVQPRHDEQQYTFGSRAPLVNNEELPAQEYVPQPQGAMSLPAYAQAVNNPSAPQQYGQMAPPPKYDTAMETR